MLKKDYLKKRNELLDQAQAKLDESNVEEATKLRNQVEELDSKFENEAAEAANLNALRGEHIEMPKENLNIEAVSSVDCYRTAFMKNLMGLDMSPEEKTAFTTGSSSAGAAIPETTMNKIITKAKEQAPLLNEIDLIHVNGTVKYAVEGTVNDAELHAENGDITADEDTLVEVNLGAYEITKLVRISAAADTMTIDDFENWLINLIAEKIARKCVTYILTGTGSSQPSGLGAITWDSDNSVEVALAGSLSVANVNTLESLLPGGYDSNAIYVMSKKTLFQDFKPLCDKNKGVTIEKEGKQWFINGYPVQLDSSVTLHEAYLGDFKRIAGNLQKNMTLDKAKNLSKNAMEYLGAGLFDCQVAIEEAFVKLKKATS